MAIQGRQEIGNVTINIGNPTPQIQNVGSPLTTDADDRKEISNYDAYDGYSESGLLGYQQGDIINYAPIINNTYIVSSGATIIETGGGSFNGLLSGTGVIEFSGRTKIYSNSNGTLNITNNAQNSGATITVRSVVLDTNDLYNSTTWNDNLSVPTKDAVREQVESMISSIDAANTNSTNAVNSGNLALTRANTLSGHLVYVSGNLNSLSGYVLTITGNAAQSNVNTLSGHLVTVSGTLNTNVAYTNLIANNLNVVSGLATNLSGHVVTVSGTVNSHTTSLSNLSGTTSTLTTNLNTISGRLNTVSGNLVTVSGITANNTTAINTLSGNLITVSGLIGPNTSGAFTSLSGSLVTVSGTVETNEAYMNLIADNLNLCSGRVDNLYNLQTGAFLDVSQPPWSLIPVDGPSGSGQAAATYNTLQLNRIFNDRTSGCIATRQTVKFPGNGYCINDTIVIPPKTAIRVEGQGLDDVYSENPWYNPTQSVLGGPASRLIWIGTNDRPMITNYSFGLHWDSVILQGKLLITDAEYQNLLTGVGVSGGLSPLPASYLTGLAQVGMMVANVTSGLAPGKMFIPAQVISLCQTGISFGSGFAVNSEANETQIGYLRGNHCGVLMAIRGLNSQLYSIDYLHPYRCNTGVYITGGGNLNVQSATCIAPTGVLIATDAIDVNTPIVSLTSVAVDNGFKNGRIIKMNQARSAFFGINDMFIANNIPTGNPLFEISGNAQLKIGSCFGAYEQMIKAGVNAASTGESPNVNLACFRMKAGTLTPDNILTTSSRGPIYVTHKDCQNFSGVPIDSNRYNWNLGVRTNSPDISMYADSIPGGSVINVMDVPWNLIPANDNSSQAAATYNTMQLNRLFNSSSGLENNPLTVYFPGRSFLINDSIILPPKFSFRVEGNGFLPSLESGVALFNNTWSGSTPSKIVWVGPTDRPMIINYSPGTRWEVPLVGYFADTNGKQVAATASTNVPPSVLTGFAQIGMLIPNQTSGIACGKLNITAFATVFCQTGLVFGSGALTGNNADESYIGYFYPQFCGVGMATRTQNAQLFTIGHLTPYACNTGIFISGGGNITVQHAVAIASGGVLFEVGNTTVNTPIVHIGMLSIDNGFINGRVLKMSPSPDVPKPLNFTVESMFIANGITGGQPLFELRDAAMLGINAGFGIQEGIIRFINTTGTFTPTASLYRMRMAHTPTAASPTGFVHSTSTGTGIITHRDSQSYYGSYFNSNRYSWGNSVITNMTGF